MKSQEQRGVDHNIDDHIIGQTCHHVCQQWCDPSLSKRRSRIVGWTSNGYSRRCPKAGTWSIMLIWFHIQECLRCGWVNLGQVVFIPKRRVSHNVLMKRKRWSAFPKESFLPRAAQEAAVIKHHKRKRWIAFPKEGFNHKQGKDGLFSPKRVFIPKRRQGLHSKFYVIIRMADMMANMPMSAWVHSPIIQAVREQTETTARDETKWI